MASEFPRANNRPRVSNSKTQTSQSQSKSMAHRSSNRRSTNLSTRSHVPTSGSGSGTVSCHQTTDFSSSKAKANPRLATQLKPGYPKWMRIVRTRATKAPPKVDATTTIKRNIGSNSKTKTRVDSRKGFCEICAEKKHNNEIIRINETCSHSFCSICITEHVRARITDNQATVPCLGLDCKQVVEFQTCAGILPQDVRDRWDRALCEALILADHKFYCPFRDCSAMLVNDGEMVIEECDCPHCHRLFCAQCRVPWHAGVSCREFQSLNDDERGTEDLMVRQLAAEKNWGRCPQCKYFVERTKGCPHIVCRCRFEFCYGCGSKWSRNHEGCYRI